jgi:glutathione synthase/RimK-type ligase-like ATP-grasp enzyme
MTMKRRALLLAEDFRLPYRVLRCASSCCEEVYVLGTAGSSKLRMSNSCARYFPVGGSYREFGDDEVNHINSLCAEWRIDSIIPSCPTTTRFLSVFGDALEPTHYPVPTAVVFDLLDDKGRFADLCAELGVPRPDTRSVPAVEDLHRMVSEGRLAYPFIIKPANLWGSAGVKKISCDDELPDSLNYSPIIVQQYISGHEICAFFLCDNGDIKASVQYAREATRSTFVHEPEIERYARVIIKHLMCSGVVGFDVRRDARGDFYFIECNPRFWYRMHFAALAGLNFVNAGLSPANDVVGSIQAINGIMVQGYRDLFRCMLMPWRMTDYDVAHLRYLMADPIPTIAAAIDKITKPSRVANGSLF